MTHCSGKDNVRSAWRHAAPQLAAWAERLLVNRRDVWGAYIPPERRRTPDQKSYTAPALRDPSRSAEQVERRLVWR